ncbi:MAG: Asp-tRNA(Asn)/Glu-tRNA(Gln) amidotransferase subunit GatB [Candidatus Omnitrophica bacterium]|nr:Asp-tRNA(Asn)/Glu-tRNA(Gln) amidotransferase subunit GatB [Candidatus Omnitrophota bacterium]MBU4149087.1 Asp-tRNA(Asn)/Glu-tRNA(Gln) amidotransferase subunit GatB [Candidatus Omnitrophota bacterium]
MTDYEIVIGLEVHLQLKTKSKVFCGCSTAFGAPPNTHVCPVCLGFPGSLPVLNRDALKLGAKTAIALNCRVEEEIKFDRKNYFYPDLPKAYQISQFSQPLSRHGYLQILFDGKEKRIGITRVHLEEDTGKLFHTQDASLIDFNRSGTPLLEIVSEPDMSSPEEAYLYLTALKSILEYIDVSDCNMEEGSLRCDANVSVRKKGVKELGVKTEIKNMNSFKAVKAALEYEAERQIETIGSGGKITQETRLFDSARGVTEPMRSKEESHDYRYFPEPDLTPFDFAKNILEDVKNEMPELPGPKRKRFMSNYGLSDYDAAVLVSDKAMADYFEKCASLYRNSKIIANWIMGDISAYMKEHGLTIDRLNLKSEYLTGMLDMIDKGVISGKIAKSLLIDSIQTGKDPILLVKEKGLEQITDAGQIDQAVDQVIKENQKIVGDFISGKQNAVMALVGKVMTKTKGKANPRKVIEMLKKRLKGEA